MEVKTQIHTKGADHMRTQENLAIYKPRREASEETNPVDNLSQTFGLQDCEKINMSFKLSSLWYFVMAALENYYSGLLLR